MQTLDDFEQRLRRELTDEAAENAVVVLEPAKPEPTQVTVHVECAETLCRWRMEFIRDPYSGRIDAAEMFPIERVSI